MGKETVQGSKAILNSYRFWSLFQPPQEVKTSMPAHCFPKGWQSLGLAGSYVRSGPERQLKSGSFVQSNFPLTSLPDPCFSSFPISDLMENCPLCCFNPWAVAQEEQRWNSFQHCKKPHMGRQQWIKHKHRVHLFFNLEYLTPVELFYIQKSHLLL